MWRLLAPLAAVFFITDDRWPPATDRGFGTLGPMPQLRGFRFRPSAQTAEGGDPIGIEVLLGLRLSAPLDLST